MKPAHLLFLPCLLLASSVRASEPVELSVIHRIKAEAFRNGQVMDHLMARPIFEAWLAPLRDLGAGTLTIRDTDGTDHLCFDAVGLPGFQFIQDPLDYDSRTHHSNLDVYDHVETADLMQASAIVASFVYHAAMRPQPLPRKPLPPAPPSRKPLAPDDAP